jgi:FHA domain-containing protein
MAGFGILLRFLKVAGSSAIEGRTLVLAEELSRPPGSPPASTASTCRAPSGDITTGTAAMVLVVTEGESLGLRIVIGTAPIVIGRGLGVDLQVKDPTVSRHHCVVWCAAGRCWVRDLGSTNRTRVNNHAFLVTEILEGDVVLVGQTALTLALARRFDEPGAACLHAATPA